VWRNKQCRCIAGRCTAKSRMRNLGTQCAGGNGGAVGGPPHRRAVLGGDLPSSAEPRKRPEQLPLVCHAAAGAHRELCARLARTESRALQVSTAGV
jgi:hypothetical protein